MLFRLKNLDAGIAHRETAPPSAPVGLEVIPERRVHAKGSSASGTCTVAHDVTTYSKAELFAKRGKSAPVVQQRGLPDAH
jgi:Catalase